MTNDAELETAKRRFLLLSLARLGGAGAMGLGLVIWHTGLIQPAGLPALGLPLFVAGALETIILPKLLARKWRSTDQT